MRRLITALLLALVPWLLLAAPVLALSPPDSMLIYSAQVTRNTIEEGDVTITFHYYIEDESYTDPADNTIMFRLYDTDNVTLLSSTVPFVFFGYGYGQGCGSFYFSAADNLTWGEAYRINIAGSPAFFDPLPNPYNYFIDPTEYCVSAITSYNRDTLADYVLGVAQQLETANPTYTLYGSTDIGMVLSANGEAYFRGAIPGLQGMCPELFMTQSYIPSIESFGFDDTQAADYGERLKDTDVMVGFTEIGDEIGTNGQSVAGGFAVLAALACIVGTVKIGWGPHPGIMAGGLLLSFAALLLGDAIMAVRLTIGLLGGAMVMYILFFKRS